MTTMIGKLVWLFFAIVMVAWSVALVVRAIRMADDLDVFVTTFLGILNMISLVLAVLTVLDHP